MFRVVFQPSSGAQTLYLQYLALMRPVLLPVVKVTSRSRQVAVTVSLMPDTAATVL